MKTLALTIAAMMIATLAVTAGPATAQITSNGPYYATPSWDQTLMCTTLSACSRFIVLSNMNSDAVLDRETGLVWERSPAASPRDFIDWSDARGLCTKRTTGGRKGWRLPSVHELASLVDPNNVDTTFVNPALPPGHPFIGVQPGAFWTATTDAAVANFSWDLNFRDGSVSSGGRTGFESVWCVRGGMNADAY